VILNGSSGIFMFVHSVLLNEVVMQELRIRLRIDSKAVLQFPKNILFERRVSSHETNNSFERTEHFKKHFLTVQ
jgi:hypothetical protein